MKGSEACSEVARSDAQGQAGLRDRRKAERPCYREQTNGVHFTRNAHRPDCEDSQCRGCITCTGRHCTARKNCTWHIAASEQTCGRCIGGARREIRWIVNLSALTATQAIMDGLESEALNLTGPAADPRSLSEWQVARKNYLRSWEERGKITEQQHLHAIEAMNADDEHHPYAVLTRWQMMIAEDYDHELPGRLSIAGAAGYLDRNLHRIAHDDTQDFPLLRRELRKCRQHLESVLHNDTNPDRGAPCPTCRAEHRTDCEDVTCRGCLIVRLTRQYAHHCEDEACERFHFTDDGSDTWHCPRNAKHWWTQAGYADVLRDRQDMSA